MSTDTLRKEFETMRYQFDVALPNICANCEATSDLHIHHIVPISFGGRNTISNLVRLCAVCHAKAHGGNDLIAKATESKRNNIAKGGRFASRIPYGYKYIEGQYVVCEENAKVIRMIFRLRYQGEYSTLNIATILNNLAIPTALNASKWSHPPIVKMLANAQYVGESVYKGESLGSLYPAIIEGELFDSIKVFEDKYAGRRLPPRSINVI